MIVQRSFNEIIKSYDSSLTKQKQTDKQTTTTTHTQKTHTQKKQQQQQQQKLAKIDKAFKWFTLLALLINKVILVVSKHGA